MHAWCLPRKSLIIYRWLLILADCRSLCFESVRWPFIPAGLTRPLELAVHVCGQWLPPTVATATYCCVCVSNRSFPDFPRKSQLHGSPKLPAHTFDILPCSLAPPTSGQRASRRNSAASSLSQQSAFRHTQVAFHIKIAPFAMWHLFRSRTLDLQYL